MSTPKRNWSVIPTINYRNGWPTYETDDSDDTAVLVGVDRSRLMGWAQYDDDRAVPVVGALIRDHDLDLIYETAVDQSSGALISLTVHTIKPGQRIDMRRVPSERIREQTIACLAALHNTDDVPAAMRVFIKDGPYDRPKEGPTVEQVARDYNAGMTRTAIYKKFKGTEWSTSQGTIDRRIGEADLAELLIKRTTSSGKPIGRPRKATANPTSSDQ